MTTTPAPSTPAPSTPAASARVPATPAVDDAATIPLLRHQIDALDQAVQRLVTERAALSVRVQRARMAAGGTRVELGRERLIMASYREALGTHGPALADAVLQVCRGSR